MPADDARARPMINVSNACAEACADGNFIEIRVNCYSKCFIRTVFLTF